MLLLLDYLAIPGPCLHLGVVRQDLDPVIVRIVDERNVPHPALLWPLLELDAHVVESLAGGIEIIDRNADMAETTSWLLVSVGVAFEVLVGFYDQRLGPGLF